MLALELKGGAFIEKVNSRCFCWFPAAILVDSFCPPIWRLHTKLYKGAWNVSATNSETVGHKDLRFGQIVYILVFYNISFSWLLPLDGFQFCAAFIACPDCVTEKTNNAYQFFLKKILSYASFWFCNFSLTLIQNVENNDDNNNNTADNNNRQNGIPKTVLKACQNSKLLPKFQSYHLNFLDIFIIINVN